MHRASRVYRWAFVASLMFLIPAWAARAAEPQPSLAPIHFEQETLDNGLRVLYAPLKQAPVVHVRVMYHVGSRDERPDRQGFAHMFEHMMFRGSAHVKPEQHMKLINDVGGISNAFTSFDQTTYVNTVPSEHTEMALWLEADRMASFKVSDEIYRTERKVVAEEWRMRMNQPYGNMFEEFLKRVYTTHSYQWTPIGNMEHLRAAAASELQSFFNAYYVPNNAVLVIAGDIEIPQARAWARRYFGWIPRGPEPQRLARPEPPQTQAREASIPAAVPLPAVLVAAKTPAYKSDDAYGLGVLSDILGGGASSRLYRRLVASDNPLATNASAMFQQFEDSGFFGAHAILLAGKDPSEVQKVLQEELLNLAQKGVTPEELDKAKVQYRQHLVTGRKTAEQIARNVGEEWLFGDDPARANRELEKVESLTVESVKAIAAKYIKPEALTVLQMVPDPTGEARKKNAAAAQAATSPEVVASTQPVAPRVTEFPKDYPTQPPIAEPRTTAKFAKGQEFPVGPAKLIVMPDQRLPLATVILALRRGSHSEPVGKEGLGAITAAMLRRGAGGMTFAELNQRLDSRAISLAVSDQGDYTQLAISCPSPQLEEAMRLAKLLLREPNFDETEFKKLKAQSMSGLIRSLASPTKVAEDQIEEMVYGGSPLGRNMTPQSLASIELSDVKDFYAQVYRFPDSILIVAGDVTVDNARQLADKLFEGAATAALIPAPAYEFPPIFASRRIVVIDNKEGQQATVRMAIRAYTTASDEKYAGILANQILSGGIESRVMRYVRAEKGLAYHAHGVFTPGRQAGVFSASTDTKVETAADAIEAMCKVFADMRQTPVTDAELKESKLRVTGLLVMGMQTIEQQADRRLAGILNGYPLDYYDRYAQNVSKVSAKELQELMQKYVENGRMAITVVAPAAAVEAQLSKLGPVQIKPMPSAQPAKKP